MENKYKNIPAEVLKHAQYYLNMGCTIEYVGKFDNVEFYRVNEPSRAETGYPLVYGFTDGKVYRVDAFDTHELLHELLH